MDVLVVVCGVEGAWCGDVVSGHDDTDSGASLWGDVVKVGADGLDAVAVVRNGIGEPGDVLVVLEGAGDELDDGVWWADQVEESAEGHEEVARVVVVLLAPCGARGLAG